MKIFKSKSFYIWLFCAVVFVAYTISLLPRQYAQAAKDVGIGTSLIREEGSWTPVLTGTTTAGDCTYTTQVGRYYKVGSFVHATANILTSTCGTAPVGDLLIAGLPYTSNATADGSGCYWTRAEDYVLENASDTIVLEIQAATTSVRLQAYAPGAATPASAPIDVAFTLRFVCDYKTNVTKRN